MRVKVVTSWPELLQHRDAWSALLAESSCNEPTLSPDWLGAWWETFGGDDGRKLRAALVLRGERLVGLAPLVLRRVWYRNVLPVRRIELLGSGEREEDEICSDYINVIAAAGHEPLVARAVVAALAGGALGAWDELVLDTMNARATMTRELAGKLAQAGCQVEEIARRPCPYALLPGSFDEYLATLSSSGRYTVRRTLRDLHKWAGDSIEVARAETAEDIERGLAILIDLHGDRWQQAGRDGVFRSAKFLSFHRRVLPRLLAAGALDLMWLSARGEPIAAVYNIVWNDKVYFYQSGRRTDLPRQIRPGIAMHAYAMQHAIAQGRTVYDFLSGASRYKAQLSMAENPLVQVRATPSGSMVAALQRQARRGEDVLRRLRERARRHSPDLAAGASDAPDANGPPHDQNNP